MPIKYSSNKNVEKIVLLLTAFCYLLNSCNNVANEKQEEVNKHDSLIPQAKAKKRYMTHETRNILIVGGGKNESDLDAFIEKWSKITNNRVVTEFPSKGPVLLTRALSDSIIGLNKGFHIVIAGYCEYESETIHLRNYIKEVLQ